MESDKYFSLGDSYIEIQGDEKGVAQYIDDKSNGKTKFVLFTKSLPNKTPVKMTKLNLKKTFKVNFLYNVNIVDYYMNTVYDMQNEKDLFCHYNVFEYNHHFLTVY